MDVLCTPHFCLVCRTLTYFRCRISVHLNPKERRAASLSLRPSPGLSLSFLQKNLSPAAHFLCDSFQASQLCLSLAVFLCLQPQDASATAAQGLTFLRRQWVRRVWVFFFSFLLILFCLCFCCC